MTSEWMVGNTEVIREPFQRFVSWSRNVVPEKYAWGHSTYNALIEKVNCGFVIRAVALCSKGVQASSRGSGIARPTAKW